MESKKQRLCSTGLLNIVREELSKCRLPESSQAEISTKDCVLSCLAVFGLKSPSLLKFDQNRRNKKFSHNLKKLYGMEHIPSDTCMRKRLDELPPEKLRGCFKKLFAHLQRSKKLEEYSYLDGHYVLALDGTGQYTSKKVKCKHCCQKQHRNGEVTYYHHLLSGVILHPKKKQVIPLAPEPIVNGDGNTKNDCERRAADRFLRHFRREHPHLKVIVVQDALSANYPHLKLLEELKLPYIIGIKKGSHVTLFDWLKHSKPRELMIEEEGVKRCFRWVNGAPLNDRHYDHKVNVLEYWEEKPGKKIVRFSWITSFEINEKNIEALMRAGRARWKIENETFNTLKNQGYDFEHNYGHGYKNLCSVMSMLMLLAFLMDQIKEITCKAYQKVRRVPSTLKSLFEETRAILFWFNWESWESLYESMAAAKAYS